MIVKTLYLLLFSFLFGAAACLPTKKGNTNITPEKKAAASDSFLQNLLAQYPQYFDSLLKGPEWGIQIVYTRIDRNRKNHPRFTQYSLQTDSGTYFYPASTVKLPAAILALQKLNELQVPGLDKYSTMITEKEGPAQTAVYNDPTTADGRPTVAHYIKKILLVSDNDAFNRLYEFLGQEYLNTTLHKMGWDSVQILHRLEVSLTEEENRFTNGVTFYDSAAKMIYHQASMKSRLTYQRRSNRLGKGFYRGDSLLNEPFNFSGKNRLPLPDLHQMLQRLLFPQSVPKKLRFKLTKDDYRFLYKYMSMPPRASKFPEYDSSYNDAYVKFLFYGARDTLSPGIRIFNKVGDAYGFLTDAAYLIDTINGVEFLLSATIHCNRDGIYNDNKYEYETIGLPFMKHLGQVIYQYERNRPRKYKPHFGRFLE